jgi:glycosyltransferase involved in cell wall biosynthesis
LKICMFVSNHISNDPRVKGEAEALVKAGHVVTVYGTPREGHPVKDEWNGITFIRMAEDRKFNRKAIAGLIACINLIFSRKSFMEEYQNIREKQVAEYYMKHVTPEDYDVYHAHDIDRLKIAGYCAEKTGKPLVYDSHEYFYSGYYTSKGRTSEEDAMRYASILNIQREYIKKAKLVITVSEGIANELQIDYALKDTPLVVYNCAERKTRAKTNTLRELYLHTPYERKIVLYQGGIQRGRGLERFVELAKRIAEIDFVIIGPESQKEYSSMIRKLAEGVSNLHILPPVPYHELWNITASADFGYVYTEPISLSYEMAAPNKTFEYLAAGLPMFTINTTGTRELIAKMPEENLPLFILPEDIDDAAAYVRFVLAGANIPHCVDAAYSIAENIFNRDMESGKLVRAYGELVK